MKGNMTIQDLILNLKAAGFEGDMIDKYLSCWKAGAINEQLMLLSKKRESILDHVHSEERQINCLDYLVYQVEHGRVTV